MQIEELEAVSGQLSALLWYTLIIYICFDVSLPKQSTFGLLPAQGIRDSSTRISMIDCLVFEGSLDGFLIIGRGLSLHLDYALWYH